MVITYLNLKNLHIIYAHHKYNLITAYDKISNLSYKLSLLIYRNVEI